MNAISFGPLVLAADRFAAVAGIAVFLVVSSILSRKIDIRFEAWSWASVAIAIVVARGGHVAENSADFVDEPLRALAVWQGGFSLPWGLAAMAALSFWALTNGRLRAWALAPLGAGILSWSVLYNLSAATSGEPLPAFALRAPDGKVASIEPDGRPIVVNLWASWCPPCRREMPTLVRAAAVNGNVRFLFVNQGESAGTVDAFFEKLALHPDGVLLDPTTSVMKHYQGAGLPMTMFFDGAGRLAGTHVGEISREELSQRLRRMDSATRPDSSST